VDSRRRDPEREKIRDYTKQRRNLYGENDKSSRKAIRFRKAWVNRSYRRTVRQAIDVEWEPDLVTEAVQIVQRKDWKKSADEPLAAKVESRARPSDSNHPATSPLRTEALKRLRKAGRYPAWLP
jgi:hypothetical protein